MKLNVIANPRLWHVSAIVVTSDIETIPKGIAEVDQLTNQEGALGEIANCSTWGTG